MTKKERKLRKKKLKLLHQKRLKEKGVAEVINDAIMQFFCGYTTHEADDFDNQELYQMLKSSYNDLIQQLIIKNGQPNVPYFKISRNNQAYRNPDLIKKEGMAIHHIDEINTPLLCTPTFCITKEALSNSQDPSHLVYVNLLEHCVLHILISREGVSHILGSGGLLNCGMLENVWYNRYQYNLTLNDFKRMFWWFLEPLSTEESFHPGSQLYKKVSCIINNIQYNNLSEAKVRRDEMCCTLEDKLFTYPIGVNKISNKEYANILAQIYNKEYLTIKDYEYFYILNTGHNVAVISYNKSHQPLYWYKGKREKIYTNADINTIYNNLDNVLLKYQELYDKMKINLEMMSNLIQAEGGTGYIHGCIVDINDYNHVRYDFVNRQFIPYSAQDKSERIIYPNVQNPNFLLQNNLIASNTALSIINTSDKLSIPLKGVTIPLDIPQGLDRTPGFYVGHQSLLQLQDSIDRHVLFWMPKNIDVFNMQQDINLELTEEVKKDD